MSDVSLPRRCPRSKVSSAPGPSGGSDASRGGGSHLKPPALGSVGKNETPIRRAPQEGIDDSPPPGRAAPRLPGPRQLAARRPSPGSPRQVALEVRPPHRGMVRGRLLLRFGAVPLLLPGGGGRSRRSRQQAGRERERQGLVPAPAGRRQPPPTLPAPRSARSPPPPSPTRAARPGRRSGTARGRGPGRVGGPRAPHAARALSVPLLLPGAPQNPRFQRPQLAPPPPPPPRFQHCNCRGRYFLAYGSRRFPTRRGGEQVGARGGGRGGEGEVRPGEHPRCHRETLQSSGPLLPGAEAGGGVGRGGSMRP